MSRGKPSPFSAGGDPVTRLKRFRLVLWRGARLSRLGPTPLSRLKIFVVALLMPVKRRSRAQRSELTFRVQIDGRTGSCRIAETCDLVVLEEIFVQQVYDRPSLPEPAVIVDLGSNIGLSVLYFKLRYPDSRVFGYEADEQTFKRLEKTSLRSLE